MSLCDLNQLILELKNSCRSGNKVNNANRYFYTCLILKNERKYLHTERYMALFLLDYLQDETHYYLLAAKFPLRLHHPFIKMAQSSKLIKVLPKNSALFLCDMQENFKGMISYYPQILTTSARMLKAARTLEVPVIVTEQYPKGEDDIAVNILVLLVNPMISHPC